MIYRYLLACFLLCLGEVGCAQEVYLVSPGTEQKLKEHIHFTTSSPHSVGHIEIGKTQSGINQATWVYVKNALDYYREKKPVFIILELNTPGGEVYAAQKISDALKEIDTQSGIPVVCYVNNWAISAGAMLGYSCRFIAIAKDASFGAAEPVIASASGQMEAASEKVNSALRADFMNRAAFFGRNPLLAEAMVDKDVILVMRKGVVTKLDRESDIVKEGRNPDIVISNKGKLLTLDAEQMMRYGLADILLQPVKLVPITESEQSRGLWPASKSSLFQVPFFKEIPDCVIDAYQMDWKTRFFVFLSNPIVTSLLMLGLMVGFYMEMGSPGATLPIAVAFVCLFLLLLSSYALEAARFLEWILLFAGLSMVVFELLVPGFGFFGIIGAVFTVIGLLGMFLPSIGSISYEIDTNTLNAAGEVFMQRLGWLAATILIGFVLILVLARYITPSFSRFSKLVLRGEQDASLGFVAGGDVSRLPKPGTKAVVLATLRPAGKIQVGGDIFDAQSEGEFIEKGEEVVVQHVDGPRIFVERGDS